MSKLSEKFKDIHNSLKLESDRGVVLVTSAYIEEVLLNHIQHRLLDKLNSQDEILSRSSFDFKINLSYRIGLITKEESYIYHQLRKLRNKCAHTIESQSFNNDDFQNRMINIINKSEELWNVLKKNIIPNNLSEQKFDTPKKYVEALGWRISFQMFFGLIIAQKSISTPRVKRLDPLTE